MNYMVFSSIIAPHLRICGLILLYNNVGGIVKKYELQFISSYKTHTHTRQHGAASHVTAGPDGEMLFKFRNGIEVTVK